MKGKRIFWGVFLVLSGIFMIISKLGFFPDVNAFSLLITVFLVIVIVKSLLRINFFGVLFPIAFLCIIYDKQLGLTSITPGPVLFAAFLLSIGLSMIFHKNSKWFQGREKHDDYSFQDINIEDEDHVRFKNSFSGSIKYINSNKFERADISCTFSGIKVYFDNASMKSENAVVRIDASFSGVELYVPKNWRIEDKTDVFLGGISEKNKSDSVITNTLTLVGNISFAGVEIIYI
ncbi:LiaF transmembrane domain-containing protein [Clostridium rectalis]|uniref:LiaF transmembrane domain-containing protein n=1 Tax=Clostridium rectalis TaxID=2040295 RepID=UPI000F63FF7E|nr:hypothetical protein [Clostridium rectalis]